MKRSTIDRALDLATAALAVVVVVEQHNDIPAGTGLLWCTWRASAAVARTAGLLALKAEHAYRAQVTP